MVASTATQSRGCQSGLSSERAEDAALSDSERERAWLVESVGQVLSALNNEDQHKLLGLVGEVLTAMSRGRGRLNEEW